MKKERKNSTVEYLKYGIYGKRAIQSVHSLISFLIQNIHILLLMCVFSYIFLLQRLALALLRKRSFKIQTSK